MEQAWKASVGKAGRYLFSPVAIGDFGLRGWRENGTVAKIDAKTGQDRMAHRSCKDDLSAGVGSDGNLTAVGGLKGNVYVLGPDGKQTLDGNRTGRNHLAAAGRQ